MVLLRVGRRQVLRPGILTVFTVPSAVSTLMTCVSRPPLDAGLGADDLAARVLAANLRYGLFEGHAAALEGNDVG